MPSGGKASSLLKLRDGGFLVPPFFVGESSCSQEEVLLRIAQKMPEVNYFAVRSSVQGEDSKEKSQAGRFYSAIGVPKDHVFEEFRRVTASFGSQNGSVIIQEFIPSDKAGVVFSEVDKNKIVINAAIGLCQPVVQGCACDEYICDKKGEIISKNIPKEKEIGLFIKGRIVFQKSSAESLTSGEVEQLSKLSGQIQSFFGLPQDIEWCFWKGNLYVLQSRPITRDFRVEKTEYFFDSANIAESYSGIVLPLTYSYAQHVYENAYKDLLRGSGVSREKIEMYRHVFENLLGLFCGRMYYNMNNWYRMTAFVPGYKRNKKNFELMITSNVKEEIEVTIKPSLLLKVFYPLLAFIKVLLFGLTARRFRFVVQQEIRRLQNYDFTELGYSECVLLFKELNQGLLHRWYVTLENDFLVMTHLGFLKRFASERELQKLIIFQSKATEQVAALSQLSKKVQATPPLWDAVEKGDAGTFDSIIADNDAIRAEISGYLEKFGGRFANELKLESVGIDEDTAKFLSVLKLYSKYKPAPRGMGDEVIALSPLKKLLFELILKKFKKYASQREEFRLLRSNAFGITRRLFKRMGGLLAEQKIVQKSADVFYLTLNETLNEQALNQQLIQTTIQKRKQDYASYEKVSVPTHFSTRDGLLPQAITLKIGLKSPVIEARPSSPGVVRGRVKIFKDFFIPANADFDILVASHTDPGWTALIALAKGLIIEHGGVLSHASIVARELNIPAVIGAENATNFLKDNQTVEIDGSTGLIKLIA